MAGFDWTPSLTLPPRPQSFAGVGGAEMVAQARGLAPKLKERAAECERLRRLPDQTERDLHAAGLFRIVQPARVGGADLSLEVLLDVSIELAKACASTAWNVGNLGSHHWMLGYFDPAAQDEIWEVSPDTLIATSLAFPAGRGRQVAGGYVVSGRWPFSSGVDNSDWNLLAVTVRDSDDGPPSDQRFALLHRSQYEIIDNWYAMGLCGTGSKDVAVHDVFVPEYRTISLSEMRGGTHRGSAVNPGALLRMPFMSIGAYILAGPGLGCALGAYERYVATARERNTTYGGVKIGGFQAVQIKVAQAGALVEGAIAIARADCRHAWGIAERGEVPGLDDKVRYRRNAAFCVQQARAAVDLVMEISGAGGLYNTGDMQRSFRDMHAIASHIMYSFDVQGTMFGQHVLGIPGPAAAL